MDTPIDTPVANKKNENYIEFDCKVDMQTPLEKFPKGTLGCGKNL